LVLVDKGASASLDKELVRYSWYSAILIRTEAEFTSLAHLEIQSLFSYFIFSNSILTIVVLIFHTYSVRLINKYI